jgi:Heavy metal binding domain
MIRRLAWPCLATVVLGGCAASMLEPLPATHPASPLAAEGPAPPPSGLAGSAELPSAAGYTCPMHADVHASQPGRCPRCGMELVPDTRARGSHAH